MTFQIYWIAQNLLRGQSDHGQHKISWIFLSHLRRRLGKYGKTTFSLPYFLLFFSKSVGIWIKYRIFIYLFWAFLFIRSSNIQNSFIIIYIFLSFFSHLTNKWYIIHTELLNPFISMVLWISLKNKRGEKPFSCIFLV